MFLYDSAWQYLDSSQKTVQLYDPSSILRVFIYHNVLLRAPLRRPQSDSEVKAMKHSALPPKNRPESLLWFHRLWIVMHPN